MAAATARGTSDACIVAWPSPLRAAVLSKRCDLGHRTKLSIESRGGATGGARLNRRSAPFGCAADNRQTTQTIPVAALASAPQPSEAGWLMAGEGDGDLGFAADDGVGGDVVGHAVEGAGDGALTRSPRDSQLRRMLSSGRCGPSGLRRFPTSHRVYKVTTALEVVDDVDATCSGWIGLGTVNSPLPHPGPGDHLARHKVGRPVGNV
jgi:hypothetical protein